MKILSLCSGYEGLGMAVQSAIGGELAWVADIDPDASRLLAHRFPDVLNLGDVKTVDWPSLGVVDVLCAGYPCQPWSQAGRRLGTDDPRHLWPYIAEAIGILRPPLVVLENVHGHLTLGFDVVLADLAALGYDAEWVVVTASAAGACHRRARLFILAFPAGTRAVAGVPVAVIRGGEWLEPCEGLFGAVPFAGRIPASGSMAGGRVCEAPDGPVTEMAAGLLPTPQEFDSHFGEVGISPEAAARQMRRTDGYQRSTTGSLTKDLLMLKTPTAQLAINGGSQHPDKRRAGGHGPTLADQVEHELALLPTPQATDGQGGPRAVPEDRTHRGTDHGPRLRDMAPALLPTPSVADGTGGHKTRSGDRKGEPLLGGIEMLLPTPTVQHTARNATANRRSPKPTTDTDGWTLADVVWQGEVPPGTDLTRLLPTPAAGNFNDGESLESWEARRQANLAKGINGNGQGTPLAIAAQQIADVIDWGPYEAAIRRWQAVTGRPAPAPTVPGKTGQRLNPELPEWMMGLPAGWITDVPGLSRNAQLKLAGNGVVPQQCALALAILLPRTGLTREREAA